MRWQQTEFIFKGIYLGLLLFCGLVLREPDWWKEIAQLAICTFGTLALFLAVAGFRKLREGYRVQGRYPTFLLFLLLENPGMVFAGVLLGMLLGAFSLLENFNFFGSSNTHNLDTEETLLLWCVLGGAAVGAVFDILYDAPSLQARRWYGLALGAALAAAGIGLLPSVMEVDQPRIMFATLLLLGIPLFYILTLASMTEESEVEIAAICAALGVSLWFVVDYFLPGNNTQLTVQVVPLALYWVYTRRVLPELRVFKHVLRGISYANVGQMRPALISLGRALQLEPRHTLAREQLWHVHRLMDFSKVVQDPQMMALLNFELCLERVASLLLAGKPRPEHLHEAHRLLDLVAGQRPDMRPRCDYWRAVAFTHEGRFDEAAAALEAVLSGEGTEPANPHWIAILFPAWQLALSLHPELTRRVGTPQLAIPGRRMQAIAAVEHRLGQNPDDTSAWDLKRLLYADLTEAEYLTRVAAGKPPALFDHAYASQLGLAQINDPERWLRGCEFLHIAAIGLPAQAPTLYLTIAKAHEQAGNFAEVWNYYERIKQTGRTFGPDNLADQDKATFFAVVKALGEDAAKRGDNDAAIENFCIFANYDRAGVNVYRTLAELFERKGGIYIWEALYATHHGLVLDKTDRDLLDRRDRYYYSIQPADLPARWDRVRMWFDVAYCKEKARVALDNMGGNLDLLDWASHLADLAQVAEPSSLGVRYLRARALRARGEVDKAIAVLEEVRSNKPERFATSEEEDAWFVCHRLLGDLYLDVKPDQAILCFQEFRQHGKSGADTIHKMGLAFRNLGDVARASKCFETVAAYENHPLAPEARRLLYELRTPAPAPQQEPIA
jgi:tetratricopeptide (TPR) repeat protein